MKTKAVSIALAALMAAASFAACSNKNKPAQVSADDRTEQAQTLPPASNLPTEAPSSAPTAAPTAPPRAGETDEPLTDAPASSEPTSAPTETLTNAPTAKPTPAPTAAPTEKPTAAPTQMPTAAPTAAPTPTPSPTATPAPQGLREGRYTGEIEKFVDAMNSTINYKVTITFRGGHYEYSVHLKISGGMSHEADETYSGDYTVNGSNMTLTGRFSSGVISSNTVSLTGYLSSFSGSRDTVEVVFDP